MAAKLGASRESRGWGKGERMAPPSNKPVRCLKIASSVKDNWHTMIDSFHSPWRQTLLSPTGAAAIYGSLQWKHIPGPTALNILQASAGSIQPQRGKATNSRRNCPQRAILPWRSGCIQLSLPHAPRRQYCYTQFYLTNNGCLKQDVWQCFD